MAERARTWAYAGRKLDDSRERLFIMQRIANFMPVSARELDESLELAGTGKNRPARRLNEIMDHQSKIGAPSGPKNAARAVTHEYLGYARGSRSVVGALAVISARLKEPANPNGRLVDVIGSTEGVRSLVQHIDLTEFALGKVAHPSPLERNYLAKIADEQLAERMREMRVIEAMRALPGATANHEARGEFWRAQIEMLGSHPVAGPIIQNTTSVKPL